MSKTFPKIGKAITMAAKEGGNDPVNNSKLRLAIQAAKAANMPKDNVDAAIKRASGKDAADIKEINYEGKGPHGVMIFVECATDNTNRSIANIKTYFNKSGGEILPSGALNFLFKRKAVIEFEVKPDMEIEEIELGLIDSGLVRTRGRGRHRLRLRRLHRFRHSHRRRGSPRHRDQKGLSSSASPTILRTSPKSR